MEKKIFELFKDFEIYLVGGSVRDKLLNTASNDLDFATSALPEQSKSILERAGYHPHTVGWAFGTVGVIEPPYEAHITTYRKDEDYQRDNRHPKVEWGKTIQEDLKRRDFTINALAQDVNGEIIDLFNGLQHLKDKLLETPIDANQAFSDDPLRMLRVIRFKVKLDFNYSEQVKQALYNQAHRLLILPKERIQEELNKTLMTDNAADAFEDLFEYRLLNYIIPELTVLSNVEQDSKYHHKNAWLHTIGVLYNTPRDLILRYAALFHDIAKPYVFSDDDGIHFYRHEELGAKLTYSILQRLGLPKRWIKDIAYLVRNHMRANTYEYDWSDSAVRRFIKDTSDYCDKLIALSKADITSHNPTTVQKHLDTLNDLARRIEEQRNFKESPKCPVSGLAVMEYFDLPPCKRVGEIKDLILNAIISGELKQDDEEEVMLEYAKKKLET